MKNQDIYILGVGGATPVFMELAMACGYTVAGLYHYNGDRTGETDHGVPILGSFEDLYRSDLRGKVFMLSQGDMQIRSEATDRIKSLGGRIPTIIHPTAIVSPFADVSEEGVIICAGCIIQADVTIMSNAVLWDQVVVCHQSTLGHYSFAGPKALIGAHTVVDDFAFIGQDALLISGKVGKVGSHAIVGAGSVVVREVIARTVVSGNPARAKRPL